MQKERGLSNPLENSADKNVRAPLLADQVRWGGSPRRVTGLSVLGRMKSRDGSRGAKAILPEAIY